MERNKLIDKMNFPKSGYVDVLDLQQLKCQQRPKMP